MVIESRSESRAANNRSLLLEPSERIKFAEDLLPLTGAVREFEVENRILCQDLFEVLDWLPDAFVDLLVLDPPYNLDKAFNFQRFSRVGIADYSSWFEAWFRKLLRVLKPNASVYICGDWHTSTSVHLVAEKYLKIRNRITWEREKGRGAAANWKNSSEDIWFCTVGDSYTFNIEDVKLTRRVLAPYRDREGRPKDWQSQDGTNLRMTYPSNLWTDITVPFWSMSENTIHPTQKPEKLLAKIILASSNHGDFVFDPFLGSGTSAVVAKKLGRRYSGIEIDEDYCCMAAKRLAQAELGSEIQGYTDGVFWERNSGQVRRAMKHNPKSSQSTLSLGG